jgi:ABC-type phosphate transport system permease subunit
MPTADKLSNQTQSTMFLVIGAVLVVIVLGALAGTYLASVGDFNVALADNPTNSTVIDNLIATGIFQLLFAASAVFGLLGLAVAALVRSGR